MKWISNLIVASALIAAAFGASAQSVVEYVHTDSLGTPVAVTDANQNIIEQSEYEPFGQLANRPVSDGPAYTGHVSDALTGLTYMQQRYYDPQIGRFLSVDPVQPGAQGANFARYVYAANNPYRFVDPDGRMDKNDIDRENKEAQAEERKGPLNRIYEFSIKMATGAFQDAAAWANHEMNPGTPVPWGAQIRTMLLFMPPLAAEGRALSLATVETAPLRNFAATESAEAIIGRVAQSHANRGAAHLATFMSAKEQIAFAGGARTAPAMLGHAVHRATNQTLQGLYPGRFSYNATRQFDFIDMNTGQALELTTPGQAANHADRGADLVFYTLPH